MSFASDNKYHFLSRFMEWVSRVVFVPLPSVRLSVEVEFVHKFPSVGLHDCTMCKRTLKDSNLIDKIAAVNWRGVANSISKPS